MPNLPRPQFISAYYQLRQQLTDAPVTPHNEADAALILLMDEVRRDCAAKIRDAEAHREGGEWLDTASGLLDAADLIDPDKES